MNQISIIAEEGTENGQTKLDSLNGTTVNVVNTVNLNRFENSFIDVLNGIQK